MTAFPAPGFLVPDDLESSLLPSEEIKGQVAAFPGTRRGPPADGGAFHRFRVFLGRYALTRLGRFLDSMLYDD